MSYKWSPEELEQLQSLVGDVPWPMVMARYNTCAKIKGWPQRTEIALLRKCHDLGIQRRSVGEWITTGLVKELMGISYFAVQRWIKEGWLPSVRFGEGRPHSHHIKRSDLRALARQRPDLFGGQSEATLIQLLDNERLAEEIAAMNLPKPRQAIPVICVEQGRRYPSIGIAARSVYVTPQRLRAVVNTDCTAAGYHWKTA
jgi:hypothetical protein